MAAETEQGLRQEIADERRELTNAVGSLREELDEAKARSKKIGKVVAAATGAALAARTVFRLVRRRREDDD
jgi:hypothetical protein